MIEWREKSDYEYAYFLYGFHEHSPLLAICTGVFSTVVIVQNMSLSITFFLVQGVGYVCQYATPFQVIFLNQP